MADHQEEVVGVRTQSKGETHVSAGVRLITSMTYAPEVTSGKSGCLSFSSVASLWNKANAPSHLDLAQPSRIDLILFKGIKCIGELTLT